MIFFVDLIIFVNVAKNYLKLIILFFLLKLKGPNFSFKNNLMLLSFVDISPQKYIMTTLPNTLVLNTMKKVVLCL